MQFRNYVFSHKLRLLYVICVCFRIVVSNASFRLVYPMLPVSLDCPFLIAPSVFLDGHLINKTYQKKKIFLKFMLILFKKTNSNHWVLEGHTLPLSISYILSARQPYPFMYYSVIGHPFI